MVKYWNESKVVVDHCHAVRFFVDNDSVIETFQAYKCITTVLFIQLYEAVWCDFFGTAIDIAQEQDHYATILIDSFCTISTTYAKVDMVTPDFSLDVFD
jgi:hypothetical protein